MTSKTKGNHVAYARVSTQSKPEHIAEMLRYANSPGLQRQAFIKKVQSADENAAILCVRYNRSVSSVNKQGEVPIKYHVAEDDAVVDPTDDDKIVGINGNVSSCPAGAVPANKQIGDLIIPCGVCVVLGAGGAGKTPMAHALASAGVDEYAIVRVGEPIAGYTSDSEIAATSLARALLTHADVVLDSIKDLLSAGGSAMKAGISRDALVSISGWSALACETGSTVYVPVNPSTKDPDVLALLEEISRSNATMTIVHRGGSEWAYHSRTGEGLGRKEGTIGLSFREDGVGEIEGVGRTHSDRSVNPLISSISIEGYNGALRRSLESD